MKAFIAGLLLGLLLTIIAPLSFAQQSQNTQKPNPEIEALKKQISALQNQLQTVGNEKRRVRSRNFLIPKRNSLMQM